MWKRQARRWRERDDAIIRNITYISVSEWDKEEEEEEALQQVMKNPKREEWLRLSGHSFGRDGGAKSLNVRLIHQYLRRME